jgi:hypothetical protein
MRRLAPALLVAALLSTVATPAAAESKKKKKSGTTAGPVSGTSGTATGTATGTTGGASGGTVGGTTPLGPYAGPQSRSWTACGGFGALSVVCASVWLTVDGTTTTIGVENLSGAAGLTRAGEAVTSAGQWVITKVGFDNVPTAVSTTGPVETDGPWLGRTSTPAAWTAFDDGQFGGGERIDLGITNGSGVSGGIASSCAPQGSLPGGSNRLWMTPSPECAAYDVVARTNNPWFETDIFTTTTWDPNAADVTLYFKAQNGPDGASYECVLGGTTGRGGCYGIDGHLSAAGAQVVPEPGTLVLMATGAAGVGVAAWRRRRTAARATMTAAAA